MIRNAVIHLQNEQPLLADLFEPPNASDAGLVCTNLRTLDGRRPVFVATSDATFYFPYLHIRFLEIPRAALAGPGGSGDDAAGKDAVDGRNGQGPTEDEGELEIDEDFLRRIREV